MIIILLLNDKAPVTAILLLNAKAPVTSIIIIVQVNDLENKLRDQMQQSESSSLTLQQKVGALVVIANVKAPITLTRCSRGLKINHLCNKCLYHNFRSKSSRES